MSIANSPTAALLEGYLGTLEGYLGSYKKTSFRKRRVVEAATGETGVRQLIDTDFEAVLLDYSLPGIDGLEVLRQIRSHRPHVPVIMMTGYGNVSLAVATLQSGANDYLVKSALDADSLHQAINASVARCAIAIRDAEILHKTVALQHTEERYRLLAQRLQAVNERAALAIEAGGVGIWDWDVASNDILWDVRMYQLYGMQPYSEPGCYDLWVRHLHPDDRVNAERSIQQVVSDNKLCDSEFRIVWHDGTVHHIRARAQARRDQNGTVIGVVGTNWDVTEQRLEAEQRVAIIEAAPNGMMIVDEAGCITLANSQIARMFDYPHGALVGQKVEVLIPNAMVDRHVVVRSGFTSGQSHTAMSPDRQVIGRRRDGSEIMVEIMLRPVVTPRGRVVVASLLDVTERVRKFTELRETEIRERLRMEEVNANLDCLSRNLADARDQAEHANQAKTRFLASITHEIRTPLHGILGQAEMLGLEGGLTPPQRERLAVMITAGQHLLGMINTVLDMSQIEAEQVVLRPAMINLSDLVSSCLDVVRPVAEAKGLTVSFMTTADLELWADPTRLRQVLLNLLGNGVKFTSTGSVEVRQSATSSGIRLEVVDTGPGIPGEYRDKLFKTFERLSTDAMGPIEGHGLGLAIAARLLALMNGRVGHENNPRGGSVFWLELPRTEGAVAVARQPGDVVAPRRLFVLVVDDEALNRDIARGFLQHAGHDVICVESGAAAIEAVAATVFDVVLMDVRMPKMNGLEATRAIRRLPPPVSAVPVIALTAQAFSQQIEMCHEAGMNGHVPKPFTQAMLLETIHTIVDAPRRPGAAANEANTEPEIPLFDRAVLAQIATLLPASTVLQHLQTVEEVCATIAVSLRALGTQDASSDMIATAHSLAGSASTLGFRCIGEAARNFEYTACHDANETVTVIRALIDAVDATMPIIQEEIRTRWQA